MAKPLVNSTSFLSVFAALCSVFMVIPDISYASPNQTRNVTTTTSVTGLNSSFGSPDGFNSTFSQRTPNPDSQNNSTGDNTIADSGSADIAQLSGNEKVVISANFTLKPSSLQADYNITGKPTITIDGKHVDFEYPVDNNDEITLSDILMSMRASIKVNNNTATPNNENTIHKIRVFSNPDNITEHPDGTKTYVNSPNRVEHIDLDGTFYYEPTTYALLRPDGTGFLKANN
jgi:hypothetical protein